MARKVVFILMALLIVAVPCSATKLQRIATINGGQGPMETNIYLDLESIRLAECNANIGKCIIFRVLKCPEEGARNKEIAVRGMRNDALFQYYLDGWQYTVEIYELSFASHGLRLITFDLYNGNDDIIKHIRIGNATFRNVTNHHNDSIVYEAANKAYWKNSSYIDTLPWYSYADDAYYPIQ